MNKFCYQYSFYISVSHFIDPIIFMNHGEGNYMTGTCIQITILYGANIH